MLAHCDKIINKLKQSEFFKNTVLVMTGTVLAQVIGIAITPIISRLFSPWDFGVFGSFNAIAAIIAAGITLDYSQAMMLPKSDDEAINLLYISIYCVFSISAILLVIGLIIPSAIGGLTKIKGLGGLGLLIIASVISGINQASQAWSIRRKAFKHTSASQVIRSVSLAGTRIGFGYLNSGGFGLIITSILANMLASIKLLGIVLSDISVLKHNVRLSSIKKLAKEYRDFPAYSATQNVINAASAGLPVLLLGRFYGVASAGAYAFAVSVLQAPMGFILTALRQVLFQRACETQQHKKRLTPLYLKTTIGLFTIGIVPCLTFIIWAPQLFVWIFGARWLMAGEYARSLTVWLAVVFCNLPAVLFARILRIQRFVFFYDIALLSCRFIVLAIGGQFLNSYQSVAIFSLVGAMMNIFLILYVGRSLINREKSHASA